MLQNLRARVHLALNLEPRDKGAGLWAAISLTIAAFFALGYVAHRDDAFLLLLAVLFANASLSSLSWSSHRKPHTWRGRGFHAVLAVGIEVMKKAFTFDLPFRWSEIEYFLSFVLGLFFVWQVIDRFVLRPAASERRRREALGSYREEFPHL